MKPTLNALVAAMLLAVALPLAAHENESEAHHDTENQLARTHAEQSVHWDSGHRSHATVDIKLLTLNDFHGQLGAGKKVGARPVGSAPVLASYLKTAAAGMDDRVFFVHAGDQVGASPPNSALLRDEPSIMFFNEFANEHCRYRATLDWKCNVIGTPGNHEFDKGVAELRRQLRGGNHANGPFLQSPWRGARYGMISSNIISDTTNRPMFAPYAIKLVKGIPVAFIGAVLKDTPSIVTPAGIAGVHFRDEVDAINEQVLMLKKFGVHSFIVTIHQGGRQSNYVGNTDETLSTVSGTIVDIIKQLDDDVDVVVSGHTHAFTNALVPTASGKKVLVTQAFSSGTAFGEIDLEIDRETRDIVSKTGKIVTTFADAGPGLTPDAETAAMVAAADQKVGPIVNQVIGVSVANVTTSSSAAGESALGNLIADAQRASMNADIALMNPGGIRTNLDAGEVTWGELFAVQPFANDVVSMKLTGQQIIDTLNQQWVDPTHVKILQVSGIKVVYGTTTHRVIEVYFNGLPIVHDAQYNVAANSFLAGGGDGFTVLAGGTNRVVGPVDLEALVNHIKTLPQPFDARIEGRIISQ